MGYHKNLIVNYRIMGRKNGRRVLQRRGWIYSHSVTGVIADTRPFCPTPNCSAIVRASDHYPTERHPKVSRRLPTPLSWAYVCKSDLYLNIIDFPPHIRYRELVSLCVRLISMAFLSAEHDKCIWKIKFSGWVRFREFLRRELSTIQIFWGMIIECI